MIKFADRFRKHWQSVRSYANFHDLASDWEREGERISTVLEQHYAEPWRHYHTGEHVVHVQYALDHMGVLANPAVRMAGYFHDAIWLAGYPECERRSAELAEQMLSAVGINPSFTRKVGHLIMTTVHTGLPPADNAEAAIRDADLWSLGFERLAFQRAQEAVRKEFETVPEEAYMAARTAIFRRIGARQLYWTPVGSGREEQARQNLACEGITLINLWNARWDDHRGL